MLAAVLQGDASGSGFGLDDFKTVADIIGALITAAALVLGAVWAYYRFVKGRTYTPRLQVSMRGEWLTVNRKRFLLARVCVQNIGASHVVLLRKRLWIRRLADSDHTGPVKWAPARAVNILKRHSWIEPGATVSDDVLLRLDIPAGEPVLFEARLGWQQPRIGRFLRKRKIRNIRLSARQVLSAGATLDGHADERLAPDDESGLGTNEPTVRK